MTLFTELNQPTHSTIERALDAVKNEERRSDRVLHLTAHENKMSRLARSFLSSSLSFRQHEGMLEEHSHEDVITHGTFMLMGLPGVYHLELKARRAAERYLQAAVVDFRPTSGLHAMLCTIASATKPGDVVYTVDPMNGGHAASRNLLTNLGRQSEYIPWSNVDLNIDLDSFAKAVKKHPANAVYLEHGTPLFKLPLEEMRRIVGEEVVIAYDASHTLGLIAGGKFQAPLREGCDILQGNTHKTFPGPQKGLLSFRDLDLGSRITKTISDGLVSSQHTHHALAAYITALEMAVYAEEYAAQMINNARALAEALTDRGITLVSRNGEYTSSHQVLIAGEDMNEKCLRLFNCGISTNARNAFGRRVIRIGVQEATRRGMKEDEMRHIADFIRLAFDPRTHLEELAKRVYKFNQLYDSILYSFDGEFADYLNAR